MRFGMKMKSPWPTTGAAVILAISPVTAACSRSGSELAASSSAVQERSALTGVEQFVVYLSGPFQPDLGCYDMAVLDPNGYEPGEIGQLRRGGTLPTAYLNVGEIETYRWFYPYVEPSWILGTNPNWEDHFYVDARQDGWQSLLLDIVIPAIIEKGYAGLFLDMVDTALPGLYPETEPGMIELLHRIRRRYPELVLIMNHGFFLAERVSDAVDGVAAEGILTHYDFEERRYRRTAVEAQEEALRTIAFLKTGLGLEPFLIDYAGAEDVELRTYARRRAAETGLRSFVSTISLDTIPRPQDAPAPAACLEGAPGAPEPDPRP